ncbi:protoporphyrinogen oxidase [Oryzobacter telluris]|uniref:protoporphyrinogen oxidase n=1 Tax=Oryzobacter telluris TaxID=3149179 RepID=UPI00370DC46B
MAKLSFLAGLAAGYVLGARAGKQRYQQIARTSSKVWNSGPVQKQVAVAKEAARTKAAPVVADLVADAARATGERLRSSRTVTTEAIARNPGSTPGSGSSATPPHGDPWAEATRSDGAA